MHLALQGAQGRVRLLAGLRNNRPWLLVPSLSSAIAGATGVAAFGIFYSNMWSLANALSPLRLLAVMVFPLVLFVGYLIFDNNLWERAARRGAREEAVLFNVAIVVTVTIGALCMYAVLFGVTFLGAVTVIASGLLTKTLGHPVSGINYAIVTWMACSLRTVAGALGSGLADPEAVAKPPTATASGSIGPGARRRKAVGPRVSRPK
jgi:uncharacterized membrane protein